MKVRLRFWSGAFFAVLGVSISSYAADKNPWAQMALMDLGAIKDTIEVHHPGPVDPENPTYSVWLEQGFVAARGKAEQATSFGDYIFALRHYVDGFNDGHIAAYSYLKPRSVYWPKLLVGYDGTSYRVAYSEGQAKVGDTLLSCDGVAADKLYAERVAPYMGLSGLEADKARYAHKLLLEEGNPAAERINVCRFSGEQDYDIQLQWRRVSERTLSDTLQDIQGNAERRYNLSLPQKGVYWISLPSFNPTRDEIAVLNKLIQDVTARAHEIRQADAIVFDLRHNSGGSSAWGDKVVNAIWGERFTDRAHRKWYDGVDWRVTTDNIANQAKWAERWIEREGPEGPTARYYATLLDGMKAAQKEGKLFYRQNGSRPLQDNRIAAGEVTPDIYLLTDYACFSACLDMADTLLSIPGARHIGAPTRADAVYIDNRSVELPSGNGGLSFSMKVYRGRARAHNEAYIPALWYEGSDWSTETIQAWFFGSVLN